jgi:spermidine/putrescine transport system permease protein
VSVAADRGIGAPPITAPHRIRRWAANPWAKPRFLWVVGIAYVAWTLLPVAIAILFSFNATRSLTSWQGFSTRWYGADVSSVLHDQELRGALTQSLKLSSLTVLIAVPLGVAFALALDRWRGRGSGTANFLMLFSFITPEIAIGVALFLFFAKLLTSIGLGFTSQLLGLSMYEMAYPVIVVRARLLSIGKEYEEAAMDLGATPRQSVRAVLLPLLAPAILASTAIVFADTIDDFVIVSYLSNDISTQPLSTKIYTQLRGAPTPAVNAAATFMLVSTTLVIVLGYLAYRKYSHSQDAGLDSFSASI